MRKVLLGCGLVLAMATLGMAEPLVLEQADNVLKPGTLEVGLADISYQTDETKLMNASDVQVAKITVSQTAVPLYARYAFLPKLEGILNVPYYSRNFKMEAVGGGSITQDDSGLGDTVLGGKYNILDKDFKLGAAAFVSLPTGAKAFRQGINVTPLVSFRKEFPRFIVNANASYTISGEYKDETRDPSVKRQPGDIAFIGAGVEYPWKIVNLIGEVTYQSLSDAKNENASGSLATEKDSAGTRADLLLGARYNRGNLKTKLGLDLSLGEEKTRTYDYRIIAGVTYLINL